MTHSVGGLMMGCDIHAHVEVKLNGKWEHYNHLSIDRDYQLFGKIAGVRDSGFAPISDRRGLPSGISVVTQADADGCGADAHNAGWLSAIEAEEINEWYRKYRKRQSHAPPLFGYLFGNPLDLHIKYPDECDPPREDARIVFWFDN